MGTFPLPWPNRWRADTPINRGLKKLACLVEDGMRLKMANPKDPALDEKHAFVGEAHRILLEAGADPDECNAAIRLGRAATKIDRPERPAPIPAPVTPPTVPNRYYAHPTETLAVVRIRFKDGTIRELRSVPARTVDDHKNITWQVPDAGMVYCKQIAVESYHEQDDPKITRRAWYEEISP